MDAPVSASGKTIFTVNYMATQKGFTLLETLVALALLGILATVFLSGLFLSTTVGMKNKERAIADSLVRSQAEYVRTCAYVYDTGEYSVDPSLTIPSGWTVPAATVQLVHASDDGMQEVTVSASHLGNTILTIHTYKVDR